MTSCVYAFCTILCWEFLVSVTAGEYSPIHEHWCVESLIRGQSIFPSRDCLISSNKKGTTSSKVTKMFGANEIRGISSWHADLLDLCLVNSREHWWRARCDHDAVHTYTKYQNVVIKSCWRTGSHHTHIVMRSIRELGGCKRRLGYRLKWGSLEVSYNMWVHMCGRATTCIRWHGDATTDRPSHRQKTQTCMKKYLNWLTTRKDALDG